MSSIIRKPEVVVAYLLLMACVQLAALVALRVQPAPAVEAASWQVPDGYSVRVYALGDLTRVDLIEPPDDDKERALYAFWGLVHQAQARRLDVEVRDCYAIGDLTVDCKDSVTTYGSERGNHPAGIAIPRRDGP